MFIYCIQINIKWGYTENKDVLVTSEIGILRQEKTKPKWT